MVTIPLQALDTWSPQARECARCTVRESALFGALDEDDLRLVHGDITSLRFAPGERIYARGEPVPGVFTVREGLVRFEQVTAGGDRRILRLAGPGDLIGQEALLQRPCAEEAVACTEVRLCRIPRPLIERLTGARPALWHELMARWQRALEQAEAWVADLTTGAARRRVLKLLEMLAERADADGRIWMPRRPEMGAMLDMTVETASRIVSRLGREGVIALLPPRHARLDAGALARALAIEEAG